MVEGLQLGGMGKEIGFGCNCLGVLGFRVRLLGTRFNCWGEWVRVYGLGLGIMVLGFRIEVFGVLVLMLTV